MVFSVLLNRKGTSLLEIMVVVAILSILIAVAMPKTSHSTERELKFCALQLAADLRWMQQESINTLRGGVEGCPVKAGARPYILLFGGGYSITKNQNGVKQVIFPEHITLSAPCTGISFKCDGCPLTPVTVQLFADKKKRLVIIDRVGRIRVE